MPKNSEYKIGLIGLWHLGEIFSAGLAELGHKVTGISEDKDLVKNLMNFSPPLQEPDLENILRTNIENDRLFFTTDISAIKDCNVLWITHDTPISEDDEVDMSLIYESIKACTQYLSDGVLVIVTSQLPAGSSQKIQEIIKKEKPELNFDYAYTPENLRLGEAVKCFFKPGRIVIGADNEKVKEKVKDIFGGIEADFLCMSVASAEMAKHALNAFLATSLSFIYDISDACEAVGADIMEVSNALKSDPRIGSKAYLDSSIGWSGGTLGRDVKALVAIAKNNSFEVPVIASVLKKNEDRVQYVLNSLEKEFGEILGKTIALFGITYKAGTSTLRRSQALEVAKILENKGAVLRLHDPLAERDDIIKDPYIAISNADAIIFLTPWPQFKDLDFNKLKTNMKKNPIIFDYRNFFKDSEDVIKSVGFKYVGVGR